MDFLSSLAKPGQPKPSSDQPKPSSDQPTGADHQEKPASNADLLSSAKVVAAAAQAQFSNDPAKYDKAKAAGAAADILDAASGYAKLDESKGVGKYVDQAEDYLRKYGTPASGDHKAVPTATGEEKHAAEKPSGGGAGDYIKKAEEFMGKPSGDGAGDYLKKAEELLNKPSGEGGEKKEASSESGGGYGDLMKGAGGFLNK